MHKKAHLGICTPFKKTSNMGCMLSVWMHCKIEKNLEYE